MNVNIPPHTTPPRPTPPHPTPRQTQVIGAHLQTQVIGKWQTKVNGGPFSFANFQRVKVSQEAFPLCSNLSQ